MILKFFNFENKKYIYLNDSSMGIGDWGLGIGDWGLGPIPNPQSPIPIYSSREKNKYTYKINLCKFF